MDEQKLYEFRVKWNEEAITLRRMMHNAVVGALKKLETPLGHRAIWLRAELETTEGTSSRKLYLLKLIGEDMEEDLSQLLPLEEDQIGPYDKEVEIMEDAIEAARDFWNRYRNAEQSL